MSSPSDPAGYAGVTPHGTGTAPYDISAPHDDLTGVAAAAGALTGAGIIYPPGPRQQEAQALLESPQGAGAMNVISGFPDYESANVLPDANMTTPIQGAGIYPGTTQDGIPQYPGKGDVLPGIPPDGDMDDSAGDDYPGTVQDGLPTYGT